VTPRSSSPRAPRSGLLVALLLAPLSLWAAGTPPARAEPLPPLPLPPPPPSTVASLASQTVAQLFPEGAAPDAAARAQRTVTIAWRFEPPSAGPPSPLAPRIAPPNQRRAGAFLADAVEAALRARGPIAGRVPSDAEADLRLELALRVAPDRVTVTARLRRPPRTVWEALRAPQGALLRTAFAAAPLDMELRALLGLGPRAVRLDRLRLRWLGEATHPLLAQAPLLALAVADLDGDRTPEVVALQPDRVLVLRWERGGPRALLASEPLGPGGFDAPPNDAPLRHPMGRLVVVTRPDGSRAVAAAASDWARPVVFTFRDGALAALSRGAAAPGGPPDLPLRGWPLYALGPDRVLTAPWPHAVDVLSGPLREEDLASPASDAPAGELALGVYALASFPFWADASPPWDPVVVATGPGGRLRLGGSRGPRTAPATPAGDVAALGDLDADGTPELLTTSARLDGTDRLRLYALSDGGRPRLLWRARLDAPVTAATLGDLTGAGSPSVLVAVAAPSGAARLAVLVPPAARPGRP